MQHKSYFRKHLRVLIVVYQIFEYTNNISIQYVCTISIYVQPMFALFFHN